MTRRLYFHELLRLVISQKNLLFDCPQNYSNVFVWDRPKIWKCTFVFVITSYFHMRPRWSLSSLILWPELNLNTVNVLGILINKVYNMVETSLKGFSNFLILSMFYHYYECGDTKRFRRNYDTKKCHNWTI